MRERMRKGEKPVTWRKDILSDFQLGPPLLVAGVIVREFTGLERLAMSAGGGWGAVAVFLVSMVALTGLYLTGSGCYKLIRHRKHLDEAKPERGRGRKRGD